MPRLEIPLLGKALWSTGDILLRAEIDLLVKDNGGDWESVTVRVDTGTEITTMSASLARALDLPIPKVPVPGGLMVMGLRREVRAGLIRARIDGLGLDEYAFPCYFVGDPEASFDPRTILSGSRNLLGLTGVVDKIRLTFDGATAMSSPHGLLIIETA